MPKTRYNFSVDPEVIEMARFLAKGANRSVSNLIEKMIRDEYGYIQAMEIEGEKAEKAYLEKQRLAASDIDKHEVK